MRAHVIAPGRMLVLAETQAHETTDPVMASFLAFLAQDMARAPQDIRPLDTKLAKRADKLTKGIEHLARPTISAMKCRCRWSSMAGGDIVHRYCPLVRAAVPAIGGTGGSSSGEEPHGL